MTDRAKISPPKPEESWPDDHLEVHPAMELLLARMESHPQEFYGKGNSSKWTHHAGAMERSKTLWNRKEKRLFNEALRKVRMEEYHQGLMKIILA
jgi:hypothetical protein